MFCMNCGAKLPDGAKFCMNCGCKLGTMAETQVSVAQEKEGINSCKEIPQLKVGDGVFLGMWRFHIFLEPIDWRVLEVKDGKALLLSESVVASRSYHRFLPLFERRSINWENCDLREWLNGEFFQEAFKGDEGKCVIESDVPAHYNPDYDTDPGNDTKDKVFLLSVKEVLKYFKEDKNRLCRPTFSIEGAYVDKENGACCWWLRSPGETEHHVAYVLSLGNVISEGCWAWEDGNAVRPALWVDLSKMWMYGKASISYQR